VRRGAPRLFVVVPLVLAGACGAFDAEKADVNPDGGDAGDGAISSVDAADAAAEAASDVQTTDALFLNSFENGSTCDKWQPKNGASAQPSPPGHTGARACLVCVNAAAQGMAKDDVAIPAGSYNWTAWVRLADAGDADAGVKVELSATVVAGGSANVGYVNNTAFLSESWVRAQAVLNTDAGIASFIIQPSLPTCILVDDVLVEP
jgi:hypothetical protein